MTLCFGLFAEDEGRSEGSCVGLPGRREASLAVTRGGTSVGRGRARGPEREQGLSGLCRKHRCRVSLLPTLEKDRGAGGDRIGKPGSWRP